MAHRDLAILAAPHAKVERWCRDQGIQSTASLAFFSTSEDEALKEAERAVSAAWAAARSAECGIAGLARGLFAAERRGSGARNRRCLRLRRLRAWMLRARGRI